MTRVYARGSSVSSSPSPSCRLRLPGTHGAPPVDVFSSGLRRTYAPRRGPSAAFSISMVSTLKNGGHLRGSKKWDHDRGGATLTLVERVSANVDLVQGRLFRGHRARLAHAVASGRWAHTASLRGHSGQPDAAINPDQRCPGQLRRGKAQEGLQGIIWPPIRWATCSRCTPPLPTSRIGIKSASWPGRYRKSATRK